MDGEKPTVDEMRLTICCMNTVLTFSMKSLMDLRKQQVEGKNTFRDAVYHCEERFKLQKACYASTPEHYLGSSHHPDSEECKKWRKLSKNLLHKVISQPGNPS